MSGPRAFDLLKPGRTIDGASAVLLPFGPDGSIDWPAFERHLLRTIASGLRPAVNMDTGHVHLLDHSDRTRVLDLCAQLASPGWFAGAAVRDAPGDGLDFAQLATECEAVAQRGGVPVVFPSFGLAALTEPEWIDVHQQLANHTDVFVAFELGEMFHPAGRILSLDAYEALLDVAACVGAKHSSLERQPEWARLALRDRKGGCAKVRSHAEEKLVALDERIAALGRMRTALAELAATCSDEPNDAHCPILHALDEETSDAAD